MNHEVFTIGHSTHTIDQLICLLKLHQIAVIADVRSNPYSRINPQFNREQFKQDLKQSGLLYVFLGTELGARSTDPACYVNGKVQYELLAQSVLFRQGLERLQEGIAKFRVAIMCAEKEPLACHRTILVSRHLHERGFNIRHILGTGDLEDHESTTSRLLKLLHLPDEDMFRNKAQIIAQAYTMQAERIAYGSDEMTLTA